MDRLTPETRARVTSLGGRARAATTTAEQRAAIARAGAAKTNSPLGLAERLARAWSELEEAERAAIRSVLRKAGIRTS